MKKKQPRKGFENYELVDTSDIVTFGTSVFMRNDGQAIKVVFPAGQIMTFAPLDENGIEEMPLFKGTKEQLDNLTIKRSP